MVEEQKLTELEDKFGGRLTPYGMKDTDYKNQNVRFLRFAGACCPICGKNHWCQVNVTGTKVICQSEKLEDQEVNGFKFVADIPKINGYLYELVDSNKAVKFDVNKSYSSVHLFPLAAPNRLDTMYRLVLAAYPLTQKHKKNLEERGLTDEQIKLHGDRGFGSYAIADESGHAKFENFTKEVDENGEVQYKSRWIDVLQRLNFPNNLWQGVPGFSTFDQTVGGKVVARLPLFASSAIQGSDGKLKSKVPEGMLVPYYDEVNRLVGFQIRVDKADKYASIIKQLDSDKRQMRVFINDDDTYVVKLYDNTDNVNNEVIGRGKLNGEKVISGTYAKTREQYSFQVKTPSRYFWVSSRTANNGAENDGKLPVQVAYNEKIAKLNPKDEKEKVQIENYAKKPKAVWITEGGLKAYIAAAKLPEVLSESDLDKYGRDVIGIAGVNSYNKALPMLEKLNAKRVTVAYDMDLLSNDQVSDNCTKLINLLRKKGYEVEVAYWEPDKAKGIDDALAQGVPIWFTGTKEKQNNN